MISRYQSSSILTVYFKRHLTSFLLSSPTTQNAGKLVSFQNPYSFPTESIRKLSATRQVKQFTNPEPIHSHCAQSLKAIAKKGSLKEGKRVHAYMIKSGLYTIPSLQNLTLNVYVKCKALYDAEKVFDEMLVRNAVSWNIMISGFVDRVMYSMSSFYHVCSYFKRMMWDKVGLNHITFMGLLRACSEVYDVEVGRQIHCLIVMLGFHVDCFVSSALVDLYGKRGLLLDAKRVFDGVLSRDLVLWNVMVSCYVHNRLVEEAFRVYSLMQSNGSNGNCFTFSSLISSCSFSGLCNVGRHIHGLVVKLSFELDIPVASALVDMYAKNEYLDDARKCFDAMAYRNVVSWNAMIVGYGRNKNVKESLRLFKQMLLEDFRPDEVTLASVLSSCGNICATCEIEQVHGYTLKNGFQPFSSIGNSLINAYSKCGNIAGVYRCFSLVLVQDLVTWTSIIIALAYHGLSKECIEIFEKMLSSDESPDGIVFLAILSACSHGGLVNEGIRYFLLMKRYRIVPVSEHYTCLVDLLGRAGLLEEAFCVLKSMTVEPKADTLGAFIGACKVQGNVELAKWAAKKLFMVEPYNPVNYSLLSNIYATEGNWFEVHRLRKMMRNKCGNKVSGCSWIET